MSADFARRAKTLLTEIRQRLTQLKTLLDYIAKPEKRLDAAVVTVDFPEARIESFGTVGGPIRLYVLPSSIEVWVDEEDLASPKIVVADAVISDIEVEALISDYLAGELEIAVEDFRRGLWRLRSDPPGRLRRSYPPQRWV